MKKVLGKKGLGLIELIVVVGIVGFALTVLAGLGNYALKISSSLKQNVIAVNLASEMIEAAKAMKNENWSNISSLNLETPYSPTLSNHKWGANAGSETINTFTRHFTLSQVLRDANDNIAASGNADPETRKIIASVSWVENGENKQISLTAYLANWKP